jgi:hypothetical protein
MPKLPLVAAGLIPKHLNVSSLLPNTAPSEVNLLADFVFKVGLMKRKQYREGKKLSIQFSHGQGRDKLPDRGP